MQKHSEVVFGIAQSGPVPDTRRPGTDRYDIALDAALTILEDLDRLPPSNRPTRLAKVLGTILDALYESGSIDKSTTS